MKSKCRNSLVLLAVFVAILLPGPKALVAAFIYPWVNSSGSQSDPILNGDCDVSPPDGPCTLHAAIQEVNYSGGGIIQFSGQYTIQDCSLPALTAGNIALNAVTQWSGNQPGVTLSCNTSGNVILEINSSGNHVYGVGFWGGVTNVTGIKIIGGSNNVIGADIDMRRNVFQVTKYGIENISSGNNNTISSNYFGTPDGINASGLTGEYGIRSSGPSNTITNNLVVKQSSAGIYINGNNNAVNYNIIGLKASKQSAVPNLIGLIVEFSSGNDINDNTISGNDSYGIYIGTTANNNDIYKNVIGNPVGATNLHNKNAGIIIASSSDSGTIIRENRIAGNLGNGITGTGSLTIKGNTIIDNYSSGIFLNQYGTGIIGGGTTASLRNTITDNGMSGILLSGSSSVTISGNIITNNSQLLTTYHGINVSGPTAINNKISQNSIYENGGNGINLSGGANSSISPPVISSNGQRVSGTTCANCTVEIFTDAQDEGRYYEGSTVAGPTGQFSWTGSYRGQFVTATATDSSLNTSMFSTPIPAPFPWATFLPAIIGH